VLIIQDFLEKLLHQLLLQLMGMFVQIYKIFYLNEQYQKPPPPRGVF
jgi:hypothetical protein